MFGWLFGESSSAKKTVDAVINTGDALFYTEEEKAQDSKLYRDWYLKYLEATQPQNVARRLIAIVITGLWAVLVFVGAFAQALGQLETAEYIFKTLNDNVNMPFMIVIGFYFAKNIMANYKKG